MVDVGRHSSSLLTLPALDSVTRLGDLFDFGQL